MIMFNIIAASISTGIAVATGVVQANYPFLMFFYLIEIGMSNIIFGMLIA